MNKSPAPQKPKSPPLPGAGDVIATGFTGICNGNGNNSQGANLVQTKLAVLDGELVNSLKMMDSVQSNRSMKSVEQ